MKIVKNIIARIIGEVILVIALIFLICVGFLAWKLSTGPIDMVRLIPLIEEQYKKTSSDTQQNIAISALILEWNKKDHDLNFIANKVTLKNAKGSFLYIPQIDFSISPFALLIGKVKFETIWVRNVSISLTKNEDGTIQLTGAPKNSDEIFEATPATVTLNDLIYDLPNLNILWVDKARIIYNDLQNQKQSTLDPVTLFFELNKDKNGRKINGFLTLPFGNALKDNIVKLNFSTIQTPPQILLKGTFSKTPIDNFLQFLPNLPKDFDANMIVDANIEAILDNGWGIQSTNIQMNSGRGQILFPLNGQRDFIDYTNLKIDIKQDKATKEAQINNFSFQMNKKVNIALNGRLRNFNSFDTIAGDMTLQVADLPQPYFKKYWPKEYSENGAYRWLATKMDGGIFNEIKINAQFDMNKKDRDDGKSLPPQLIKVKGDMVYDGLNIDYFSPMKTAKNTQGTGVYEDLSLRLNIKKADIGGMITENAQLYFDDLITEGTGLGTLSFPVKSDIQNVFNFIATEPISAFKNIDFKPLSTKGEADLLVKLEIPLLKDTPLDAIKVNVSGTVNNTEIPNAVKNLTLSGGPFQVDATAEEIKLKGSGKLEGGDITLDWHEYFSSKDHADYLSKITATVNANDKIRKAFLSDFADYFSGNTKGDIAYIKSKNGIDTKIDLNLDLTKTVISDPEIGLLKPDEKSSNATLNVSLKNDELQSVRNINITGESLKVSNGDLDFQTFNDTPYVMKAEIPHLEFNENKISYSMSGNKTATTTKIIGYFLDIRPILNSEKSKVIDTVEQQNARTQDITVNVTQMRGADNSTLKNARATIRLNKLSRPTFFEIKANVGDKNVTDTVLIDYNPSAIDGRTLKIQSNNAGETLKAFDIYNDINGGILEIIGKPIDGGRFGDVTGMARISDFKAINTPILIRLVNALSFQNFLDAGELHFQKLEADFDWKIKDNGDVYVVRNGRTSGTSVALTFDGYIDRAIDKIRIKGTAAPLSEINKIIGQIPIIGQILTGGDALLAATYQIRGPIGNPEVTVNPLSILTPGIIRKLLFEGSSQEPANEEPVKK